MMRLRVYFLSSLTLLCVLGTTVYGVFAQEITRHPLSLQMDSVVFAENESLVALTLALTNQTDDPFIGRVVLQSSSGVQVVGNRDTVTVDAKSSVYYPLRLVITKEVPAGETPMILELIDAENDQQRAVFRSKLVIAVKKQVQLINHQPTQLMQHVGDSLAVSVLLSNLGNSDEWITVTASFPDLRGGRQLESRALLLNAFQDSVVTFKKIITRELLQIERYSVNIAALYDNGSLVNNVIVGVQNVSGNRVYADPALGGYSFDSYSNNRIHVSGRNLFNANEAMQLNGRGVFQLGEGSLGFNVDGLFYTRFNTRPLLTNTYLNYEQANKGIMVGSISENLETFINGRGVKVYAQNESQTNTVELGVVDKNFNLLGDQFQLPGGNGYTAFANTRFGRQDRDMYTGSFLYDRSPNNNSENLILMNGYQFLLNRSLSLGFDLGGGLTRPLYTPGGFKPSIAVGNKMTGTFGRYTINSVNFYSSAYYPGIRRGVLQLNERISRNFNKVNTWVSYNYYDYDPEYLAAQVFYTANFANSRVEAGAYFPFSIYFNLSVSAKSHTEKGNPVYLPDGQPQPAFTLNAYRLNKTLGWRSRNDRHMVYLSAENGFSEHVLTGERKLQIRTNATWSYRDFTLNSFFQRGDFTLFEAYSNVQRGDKEIYRFNIAPSFRKSYFRNSLRMQLDANYNRDSYGGNSLMYAGNVNYTFSRLFSGFISAHLYDYRSGSFNTRYSLFQSGITYNLPSGSGESAGKKGGVEVFLFFDNNTNGHYDEGDMPADGYVVTINGTSFVSLQDGTVRYRKVPYGTYTLSVPSSEWFAVVPPNFVLQSRELRVDVPLQRTGKIMGNFRYNYNVQTSVEFSGQYAGIRVTAIGTTGHRYEARANAQGEFSLFIPEGEYEVSVDEGTLPQQASTAFKPQMVHVRKEEPIVLPEIELTVKQRTLEIKRFSSD